MSDGVKIGPFEVLMIEDNPADVRLVEEAFKESNINNNLSVVEDGVEAVEFLHRQGKYANVLRPDLILLDLNLPRKNGVEVLQEIKSESNLRTIPVIILTVSKAEQDINKVYNLHANCYIIKPVDFHEFIRIIKGIHDFWFTIAKLPRG